MEIIQPEQSLSAQSHPISTASLTLWHRRLGHISEETVQRMEKSSLAEGMKVEGSGMGNCSACRKGKQTQSPIPSATHSQSSEVLSRMFSNLCIPIQIPSIEGYWYFVTFTDDHSQYTSISLCKHKDDTLALFKAW